jgi:hypothetical protein
MTPNTYPDLQLFMATILASLRQHFVNAPGSVVPYVGDFDSRIGGCTRGGTSMEPPRHGVGGRGGGVLGHAWYHARHDSNTWQKVNKSVE